MVIDILLYVVVVAMVFLALSTCEKKVCRHRGKFKYGVPYRGLGGVHHGRYDEKPAWKRAPKLRDGMLVWEGTVITNVARQNEIATFTLTPPEGLVNLLPALIGAPGPPKDTQEIRDIVNEELNATPIYTGLKYERYGRFGDVDIDRADPAPLRPLLPVRGGGD